jgi:hypothetical protein
MFDVNEIRCVMHGMRKTDVLFVWRFSVGEVQCWDGMLEWDHELYEIGGWLSRFNASWLALGNDVYIRVLG